MATNPMDNLDEEFKQILCLIRQHIPYVNSGPNLTQCRLWLEKLSSLNEDKIIRNSYLSELCKQLQSAKLAWPFMENPPNGSLSPLLNPEVTDTDSWITLEPICERPPPKLLKSMKTIIKKQKFDSKKSCGDIKNYDLEEKSAQNYITKDWKKTITALQLRLSEMIQQNNELNAVIQTLEIRLDEHKIKSLAHSEQALKDTESSHKTEIERLNEIHELSMKALEKSLTDKYELKITEQIATSENVTKELSNLIDKKDKEISRLSEIIQQQCLRIMNDISQLKTQVSNCTCEKKVNILKKCVSKMDKAFQRSERDYQKQIEQLRQELDLKENSLQVQLNLQKADLVTQTRTGQKEEFEAILNSLEVKYIKMLEAHEQQITKVRQHDEERIEYLTQLLEKHKIPWNKND